MTRVIWVAGHYIGTFQIPAVIDMGGEFVAWYRSELDANGWDETEVNHQRFAEWLLERGARRAVCRKYEASESEEWWALRRPPHRMEKQDPTLGKGIGHAVAAKPFADGGIVRGITADELDELTRKVCEMMDNSSRAALRQALLNELDRLSRARDDARTAD